MPNLSLVARAALAALLAGCAAHSAESPPPPAAGGAGSALVVTVNGKPLTELDLLMKLRADSHQDTLKPEYRKNVLDLLIRDELIYQEAMRLGLDASPEYAEPVRRMEAQLAELKRTKAAEAYFARELSAKAAVTEAEARQYFDEHREQLGTEHHLQQIFRRSRAEIDAAKAALDGGATFESLALAGGRAWDLGYLAWPQIPDAWRAAMDTLTPGSVSGIIDGAGDRFWIIRLVERRTVTVDFEHEKTGLMTTLKARRIEALKTSSQKALREHATIVYPPPAPNP